MKSLCEVLRLRKPILRPRRAGNAFHPLQALESRILPATLVSSTTLSYQDIDGDSVTIVFSKKILNEQNVNAIFHFNAGSVDGSNNTPQQLERIVLTEINGAAGTTITTSAIRHLARGGDSFAAIGEIDASLVDLGAVSLDGDLGRILSGDNTKSTPGLGDLSVKSIGRYGTATGASDLHSIVQGNMNSLRVRNDVKGAFIEVVGDPSGVNGGIAAVTIGGSLMGGSEANSGRVHTTGNMGAVTIAGNIEGGGGTHSGAITSFHDIKGVTINGSLIGGTNTYAGAILTDYLGGGPNVGGPGGTIGPVKIIGSLLGGTNFAAGSIISESGRLGTVAIGGSVINGSGPNSAVISSDLDMGAVTITGNLVGRGFESGAIFSGGKLASVTLGGSIQGGGIRSGLDMGDVRIGGDLIGTNYLNSGTLYSNSRISNVFIGGSIRGGSNATSGAVSARSDIGTVKIAGDIVGAAGSYSGTVVVGGSNSPKKLTALTVGGSIMGGIGSNSGSVIVSGELTSATITGNLIGGNASGTAVLVGTGTIDAGRIGTMTLGGSLIAGIDNTTGLYHENGAILAGQDIGILTIKGSMIGNTTNDARIVAFGQANPPADADVAIGTIRVSGRVERGLILAGVRPETRDLWFGATLNADAQISSVTVNGDWIASNLVAGGEAGQDGLFGTQDDAKIHSQAIPVKDQLGVVSKINSITIDGEVIGTSFTNDNFGIVAEQLVSLRLGGEVVPMLAGAHNDFLVILGIRAGGTFGDVWIREI